MPDTAEIHHLSVAFLNAKRITNALDKVSFNLKPGETLVLLGESGCGKSLTSLALMRLLPENGVYGFNSKINLDGTDILQLPEYLMRELRGRRMAMIFQEPMTALNPVMTIGEQIREQLDKNKAYSASDLNEALIK